MTALVANHSAALGCDGLATTSRGNPGCRAWCRAIARPRTRSTATALHIAFVAGLHFWLAGIFTTLPDLVRWSQALLRGGLIPLAALRESCSPFIMPSGDTAWHTHGWEYYRHDDVTIIGHGGEVRLVWRHFFRQADPDDSATVIYLDNGGRTTFDGIASPPSSPIASCRAPPGKARSRKKPCTGTVSGRWDQTVAAVAATIPADRLEATVNSVGYEP